MRILVTGAFGFVGVNIVRALAANPDVSIVATDLHLPDAVQRAYLESVAANVKALYLDVTDRAAVMGTVQAEGITHIVHGAALTPTHEQETAMPARVVDVNLGGTVNLLVAAGESEQVERVLTVSSSGVYGVPDAQSQESALQYEQDDLQLHGLYAITKRSSELLTRRFSQLSDKPMAAIRLGSIYGPMERVSQSRPFLSHPGYLAEAQKAGQHITVAGPDVVRDWTYAPDVGDAIYALFTADRWRHDVYNVSCGYGISFRQIVEAFQERGLSAEWVADVKTADVAMEPHDERLPLAVDRLRGDTAGFAPPTSFAEGVDHLLQPMTVDE